MNRKMLLEAVSTRLGKRRLVWAGVRGDDIEPLADLPQLSGSFAITGAYGRRGQVESLAYEDLSGTRVDLEAWDIDDHLDADATATFRHRLLVSLSGPSALLPYRSSRFLSAIGFARSDRCIDLGLFGGLQAAFEHKPWVESAVAALGLPHIPWTYIADEEHLRALPLMGAGPVVLRRSRTSGGQGFALVDDVEQLTDRWPSGAEGFVSVAPYLEGAIPINVGAVVWDEGITLHRPSVQLVGIPILVNRPFGYCGNDFGAARDLDDSVLGDIEHSLTSIGHWLKGFGYRGAFGADFLVHRGRTLFTEINPRFQGSTHASCQLAIEEDESCLMLEHVAAMLGMPKPNTQRPLHELVAETPDFAHIVLHSTADRSLSVDPAPLLKSLIAQPDVERVDVLTRPQLLTDVGAVIARCTMRSRVTSTGFELLEPWPSMLVAWASRRGGRMLVGQAEPRVGESG